MLQFKVIQAILFFFFLSFLFSLNTFLLLHVLGPGLDDTLEHDAFFARFVSAGERYHDNEHDLR